MKTSQRILRVALLSLVLVAAVAVVTAARWCFVPAEIYSGPDKLSAAKSPAVPASGPLRVSRTNPRYFSDAASKAVYLTGAHTWNNFQDAGAGDPPSPLDFEHHLDELQAHRFNFIRLWRWEVTRWTEPSQKRVISCPLQPWARTGPGVALDGRPKFNLERFDDQYFARLRSRVQAAGRRGFYVSIMLFEGWVVRFAPADWAFHPFNAANNINGIDGDANGDGRGLEMFVEPSPAVARLQSAYVRRVVEAVNDLDNVLYEISNENDPASFAQWQSGIVTEIRRYEATLPKQHPIGVTSSGHGNKLDFARLLATPADWVSPNPDDYDYKSDPPVADVGKVIIVDSDHLWGIGGDVPWVWKSFTRGLNPIFMDPADGTFIARPDGEPQWEAVRRALGHTAYFAARLDLANVSPRPELASTRYCLAQAGQAYLVYLPFDAARLELSRRIRRFGRAINNFRSHVPRRATVDLREAQGELSVEWFNPHSGETQLDGTVEGGRWISFRAPFTGDAVLFVHRIESPSTNG